MALPWLKIAFSRYSYARNTLKMSICPGDVGIAQRCRAGVALAWSRYWCGYVVVTMPAGRPPRGISGRFGPIFPRVSCLA